MCLEQNLIRTQTYFTHDNGARPFRVIVDNNTVFIFNNQDALLESYETEDIFIGGSDGNTILLKLENEYIYVGGEIYSFKPETKIINYISPIGNNDVPYPYAIDENGRYYLMIENVVLDDVGDYTDPYRYYYDHSLITWDIAFRQEPILKNDLGIIKFYGDGEQYTFRYRPYFITYEEMQVELENGDLIEFTQDMYRDLMKEFEEKIKCRRFDNAILHGRFI